MCGIFTYLGTNYSDFELKSLSKKIEHRGPDSTTTKRINEKLFMSFHRLTINGLTENSNQPFEKDGVYLICNGEIFNYKELMKENDLEKDYESQSDCEIILHLYLKFSVSELCEMLDGEFAFVLYDSNKDLLYIARDQLGIRSLILGKNDNNDLFISSEMKAIPFGSNDNNNNMTIKQFPAGSYWCSNNDKIYKYFYIESDTFVNDEEIIIKNIRELFINAVEKRLMSSRKIACLLSGGLDSTLVSAIVANNYEPYTLNTYSIGLKDSVDLHYAKIASDYLKTNHTTIELTTEEFLDAIEKTIKQIESYDVTTVRASVGNYLISLFIKENSNDTVIFCGDVSDEIFGSYNGFMYAENDVKFYNENVKMLSNIQYFDALRSDKCISGAGLEARVPFSDINFVKYVMSINPSLKRFDNEKIEKYLLRKAFEDLLPDELLWRKKTAFSDGVSNKDKPWYQIIKDYTDSKFTDSEYNEKKNKYSCNKPYDKESLYYREIYEKYYPNTSHTIPYFWKQPFELKNDPSAWY
jgi:asparagine synthase (glutamine-hydrolysing)